MQWYGIQIGFKPLPIARRTDETRKYWALLTPKYLQPMRLCRNQSGEIIRGTGGRALYDYMLDSDTIKNVVTEKWATKKPILDNLNNDKKNVVNAVKGFLNFAQDESGQIMIALHGSWSEEEGESCDCVVRFGQTKHLHILINKNPWNEQTFRDMVTKGASMGLYVYAFTLDDKKRYISYLKGSQFYNMGANCQRLVDLRRTTPSGATFRDVQEGELLAPDLNAGPVDFAALFGAVPDFSDDDGDSNDLDGDEAGPSRKRKRTE